MENEKLMLKTAGYTELESRLILQAVVKANDVMRAVTALCDIRMKGYVPLEDIRQLHEAIPRLKDYFPSSVSNREPDLFIATLLIGLLNGKEKKG